jgi:hypothetical protein
MMPPPDMTQQPLFFIPSPHDDHSVSGPYDLAEMAGLLRHKIISAVTLTCQPGELEWLPFGERPEYLATMELATQDEPEKEIAGIEEKTTAHQAVPTRPASVKLALAVAGVVAVVVGTGFYFVSIMDSTLGFVLASVSAIVGLVGTGFVVANLAEKNWSTRLLVFFVPLYDIFYFTSNAEKYLPYFCMRYIGIVLALAAVGGIISVDPAHAKSISDLTGL